MLLNSRSSNYIQNIILDITQRRLLISHQTNFNKMLFYLLLIAASPFVIIAFPQNLDNASVEMAQVDGFIFDGPVASESNGQQRITSTSTTTSSIILDNIYNVCVMNCPVTTEYNPVCGTDNADYVNPGRLGCAQRCGKDVTLNYYGRCSTSRTG
ncbi:LOW QUALITY PROTEIN: uncharacterized protein [Mycetomoellerius zeteki]|uniref:LOW QUALITY PROTEIN: uncharacterized protein n=1 Tax=Mycetomoellerius zeteki TaxID=64791 RepID=UPI003CC87745